MTAPADRVDRHGFGLAHVRVRGFRSARDVGFAPRALCALIGEANAGKSNLLLAMRALLDPSAPALTAEDAAADSGGTIAIDGSLADGRELRVTIRPPERPAHDGAAPPAVAFLPGALRTTTVLAETATQAPAVGAFRTRLAAGLADADGSATAPAASLVAALEQCCEEGMHELVLLIEEPELYLRPQGQRYLYRLLRRFADAGNQVIYSTHSPSFLNVARLEELALVQRHAGAGTVVEQPLSITPDEDFRVLSEFDAERSELFLARAALLVEGQTEKLAFPFVFDALGHDHDREGISIVACGGKSNIPLFARICELTGVPFVAVFDRDAPPGRRPTYSTARLNSLIVRAAGRDHVVVLAPDFEAAAGLHSHHHKPEHAWRWLRTAAPDQIAPPLLDAAHRVLALARER